jgi:hypothetical protein
MADKPRQKSDAQLLLVLACGATVEQAAKQTNTSERTIYRRLGDPAFRRELDAMRADFVQRVSGSLTASGSEAVKTLIGLLHQSVAPAVRLGASRAILELGIKVREVAELDRRLTAIEAQFGNLGDVDPTAES